MDLLLFFDHFLKTLIAHDTVEAVDWNDLSSIGALLSVFLNNSASVVWDPHLNALVFEFYWELAAPLNTLSFHQVLLENFYLFQKKAFYLLLEKLVEFERQVTNHSYL